jgi:Ca2+-transporting ATPase
MGSIAIGLPLPITAVQILWINLISDGFPDLALTIDPKRVDIMKERPRPPQERLVNRWMVTLIGIVSLTAGLVAFCSFIVVYKMTNDIIMARSVAFITLGLNSLTYVFSVRALMTPFWKNHLFENKWLTVAVLAGFILQVLPFMTPSLRQFFGLSNLGLVYWIIAIGLSIFMFFVIEIFKAGYKLYEAKRWSK